MLFSDLPDSNYLMNLNSVFHVGYQPRLLIIFKQWL